MIQKAIVIHSDDSTVSTITQTLQTLISTISRVESVAAASSLRGIDLGIVEYSHNIEQDLKLLLQTVRLVIVVVQDDTDEVLQTLSGKPIADYVSQSNPSCYVRLHSIVTKLQQNAKKKLVVVDDSQLSLTQIGSILDTQNLKYITFDDATKALTYISGQNNHVDLVITDYMMPQMDGFEFTKAVREHYTIEKLPILVLSGTQNKIMIAKFLRAGANDYISKPFIEEEFVGRVINSLKISEMFAKVQESAMKDYLTGLYNRTYFYSVADKMLESAKRNESAISICLADIDNFKKINDTYGHDVGDLALQHVANSIQKVLRRSDMLVRFGGEEFVILLSNCPVKEGYRIAQNICQFVEKHPLQLPKRKLKITLSIGVTGKMDSLDGMIKNADEYMYTAKQSGKNQAYTEEL